MVLQAAGGRSKPLLSILCIGALLMHLRLWTLDQKLMMKNLKDNLNLIQRYSYSEDTTPIHIMYASDDASLVGVAASIRSVLHYASEPVIIHYVGNTPIESLPDVQFYNLGEVAKKYKLQDYVNPHERGTEGYKGINTNLANYARFAMHELLPKNITKAMWIDVDTIAHCNVVPMFRRALSDPESPNIVAAVPGERKPRGFSKNATKEFNLTTSFNAGVYVVDLEKWRRLKVSKRIRMIAQRNREEKLYKLGSQGPLALAVGDLFERLDWVWNSKVSNFDRPDRVSNQRQACLLHWSGPNKPWDVNGTHKELWEPFARDAR